LNIYFSKEHSSCSDETYLHLQKTHKSAETHFNLQIGSSNSTASSHAKEMYSNTLYSPHR